MPKNKEKPRSKRPRFTQIITTKIKKEIKKQIKASTVKKVGITACKINCILSRAPNFLGCFAQDELTSLTICSLPVYLIVNFDHSYSSGTHWIALRISKRYLEIFDPLGFNALRWPNIPHFLLDFLHKFSIHRRILISKEIQPYASTLCGFYCIYFIVYRSANTFSNCNNLFSLNLYKNDKILTNFYNKI